MTDEAEDTEDESRGGTAVERGLTSTESSLKTIRIRMEPTSGSQIEERRDLYGLLSAYVPQEEKFLTSCSRNSSRGEIGV